MSQSSPPQFIFFGDSICKGQEVSVHKGWVHRLSQALQEEAATLGSDLVVANASINGDTTRMALDRIAFDVQSHSPIGVFVQFGMNDCNHWATDLGLPRVSTRAFQANLHEIIDRALVHGAERVIVNTNHPTTRTTQNFPRTNLTYEQSNQAYNEIVRQVVAERDGRVILLDVGAKVLEDVDAGRYKVADFVLADGLHLSEFGHQVYFETARPVVVPVLREILRGALTKAG